MAEKLIGKDISPPDLVAKITGRARYAEDFRPANMAFMKLLLSPMPHGRVRSVDTRRAERLPGFLGLLRAEEVPQRGVGFEAALTDEPRYEGEPILAVAAETEEIAADALDLIEVDVEPLPFVIDPLESLRPGGPNAYTEGNRRTREGLSEIKWNREDFEVIDAGGFPETAEPIIEWSKGDPDAALASPHLVLSETIVHQSVTHHPMEPRSNMA